MEALPVDWVFGDRLPSSVDRCSSCWNASIWLPVTVWSFIGCLPALQFKVTCSLPMVRLMLTDSHQLHPDAGRWTGQSTWLLPSPVARPVDGAVQVKPSSIDEVVHTETSLVLACNWAGKRHWPIRGWFISFNQRRSLPLMSTLNCITLPFPPLGHQIWVPSSSVPTGRSRNVQHSSNIADI